MVGSPLASAGTPRLVLILALPYNRYGTCVLERFRVAYVVCMENDVVGSLANFRSWAPTLACLVGGKDLIAPPIENLHAVIDELPGVQNRQRRTVRTDQCRGQDIINK